MTDTARKAHGMKKKELREVSGRFFREDTFPELHTAEVVAPPLKVRPERLLELAESGHAPCIRIDGGPPLFVKRDIRLWVRANLVAIQPGKAIGLPTPVAADFKPALFDMLPAALKPLFGRLLEYRAGGAIPCVYFLLKADQVVYVGQSVSLPLRITAHRTDGKDFDGVVYLPVPASELNAVESAFITALKPPLNGMPGAVVGRSGVIEQYLPAT